MAQTHDHEMVSIYPFTDDEVDAMMNNSMECVLMWATKDGWPVGVTHAFTWDDEKIWLTFSAHRHRAVAMKRDNRVSVNVSSGGYRPDVSPDLPGGAITFKGTAEFFDDEKTKNWFYTQLSQKLNPGNPDGEKFFFNVLDSPLRTVVAITPVKKIMYNGKTAGGHMAGTIKEEDLGERLSSDLGRMNKERAKRGLDER
jgi:general stress protein 26